MKYFEVGELFISVSFGGKKVVLTWVEVFCGYGEKKENWKISKSCIPKSSCRVG